ncbi:MAG TPA: FMN-binding negative transcriptional regulator [Rhizomicrobium sp.]|jgi:transcriptional regulator|nr:FMN-binding negative transcriptional regulator [Rhizomicrobium sp.]
MYRPSAFATDEVTALHDVIRQRAFATVACVIDGTIALAYAPVVLDVDTGPRGSVRFHLAGINPVAAVPDGTPFTLSFLGPDAYVSPDWYETHGRVPTWNYLAVEGRGVVQRMSGDQLRQLLINLSAVEENKLLPKKPWTIDKVPEDKMDALMNAIVGFSVRFETLEGKFKLSQNVTPEDAEGVMRGLIQRGNANGRGIAKAMRRTRT